MTGDRTEDMEHYRGGQRPGRGQERGQDRTADKTEDRTGDKTWDTTGQGIVVFECCSVTISQYHNIIIS